MYCNTGDWIENCTALVEHADGRLEMINWLKDWPELAHLPQDIDEDAEVESIQSIRSEFQI